MRAYLKAGDTLDQAVTGFAALNYDIANDVKKDKSHH
jgi:hypothetical protein